MSYSGGIISAPVSIADVQNALGVYTTSDLATLCKSSSINPWSRYKPVNCGTVYDTSDATGSWYKGTGNCGINSSGAGAYTAAALIAKYDGDMNGWAYETAEGPYRLTDFQNYYADALALFSGFMFGNADKLGQTESVEASIAQATPAADLGKPSCLSISDISAYLVDSNGKQTNTQADLSKFYLGVIVTTDSSSPTVKAVAATGETTDTTKFTFNTNFTVGTKYRVYPFLSSEKISQVADGKSGVTMYTIPKVNYTTITIQATESGAPYMYVSATVNSTKTTITCSYTIKNTSATSKTYNPNYIMLYQKGSLSSSVSLGSITLDSGASVTKTATFTGSGYTTAGSSYVQLSVRWGSNTYTSEQFGILEESGGDSNIVGPGLDG